MPSLSPFRPVAPSAHASWAGRQARFAPCIIYYYMYADAATTGMYGGTGSPAAYHPDAMLVLSLETASARYYWHVRVADEATGRSSSREHPKDERKSGKQRSAKATRPQWRLGIWSAHGPRPASRSRKKEERSALAPGSVSVCLCLEHRDRRWHGSERCGLANPQPFQNPDPMWTRTLHQHHAT